MTSFCLWNTKWYRERGIENVDSYVNMHGYCSWVFHYFTNSQFCSFLLSLLYANQTLFFSSPSYHDFAFFSSVTHKRIHMNTPIKRERERERERELLRICGWLIGIEIDAYGSMGMGLDDCGEDRCLRERERERERERIWQWEKGKQKDREVFWKGDRVERK